MTYYIRIGILSLQYKPFGHSIMFLWINEHLQDALLTKLLGQFIEVHKTQFFQRLEYLVWNSIAHFSYSILKNFKHLYGKRMWDEETHRVFKCSNLKKSGQA